MPPNEISAELERIVKHMGLLESDIRSAEERHRTMQSAVDQLMRTVFVGNGRPAVVTLLTTMEKTLETLERMNIPVTLTKLDMLFSEIDAWRQQLPSREQVNHLLEKVEQVSDAHKACPAPEMVRVLESKMSATEREVTGLSSRNALMSNRKFTLMIAMVPVLSSVMSALLSAFFAMQFANSRIKEEKQESASRVSSEYVVTHPSGDFH
jgi:hypothetical protein